jgi:hypothetical protein
MDRHQAEMSDEPARQIGIAPNDQPGRAVVNVPRLDRLALGIAKRSLGKNSAGVVGLGCPTADFHIVFVD